AAYPTVRRPSRRGCWLEWLLLVTHARSLSSRQGFTDANGRRGRPQFKLARKRQNRGFEGAPDCCCEILPSSNGPKNSSPERQVPRRTGFFISAACEPNKHVPSLATPHDDLDPDWRSLRIQCLALHQVHASTFVSSCQPVSQYDDVPLPRRGGATICLSCLSSPRPSVSPAASMSTAFDRKIHETVSNPRLQLTIYTATGRLVDKRKGSIA